jgi:DNA-binding HxlR family transcriptional regulator
MTRLTSPSKKVDAATFLPLLDDYWTAPVLAEVLAGAGRFNRIQRNLKISSPVLSERLKLLVENGVLERRVWAEQDVEYEPTEVGRRLLSLWVQRARMTNGGHATGHAASNGRAASNGHAARNRRNPSNGHRALNGHGGANGHAGSNGHNGTNGFRFDEPAVKEALDLIGARWNLLILGQVLAGRHRFTEIRDELGITGRVFTQRLNLLVDQGILERRQYQASRYEYWPTRKGRELYPVLAALARWATTRSPSAA